MQIVVSPAARRELRQLPRDVAERVAAAIDGLAHVPRPPGCLVLRHYLPLTWRLRVGDWRVLYEIDDDAGVVTISGVRHRSKAYRSR